MVRTSQKRKEEEVMKRCKYQVVHFASSMPSNCGSFAFNLDKENINQGEFCDACYWRNIVENGDLPERLFKLRREVDQLRRELREERARFRSELKMLSKGKKK